MTPHASWAALASAHRVHAGYAKSDRNSATWTIAVWAGTFLTASTLALHSPTVGEIVLSAIAAIGAAFAILIRREAAKRADRHTKQADKFEQLANYTYRYSMENR